MTSNKWQLFLPVVVVVEVVVVGEVVVAVVVVVVAGSGSGMGSNGSHSDLPPVLSFTVLNKIFLRFVISLSLLIRLMI